MAQKTSKYFHFNYFSVLIENVCQITIVIFEKENTVEALLCRRGGGLIYFVESLRGLNREGGSALLSLKNRC